MSGKDALVELLRLQREQEAAQAPADWNTVLVDWTRNLRQVLDTMRAWLDADAFKKFLRVESFTVSLSEDHLGSYEVPALRILAPAGRTVEINPRARLVSGAQGRIDMRSGPNRAILVLGQDGLWRFPATYVSGRSEVVLSEDSFSEALRELLA